MWRIGEGGKNNTLPEGNKWFVQDHFEKEKEYYNHLVKDQRLNVLWIGCSDSRVAANNHKYAAGRGLLTSKCRQHHGSESLEPQRRP